jgi:hypothetical protein
VQPRSSNKFQSVFLPLPVCKNRQFLLADTVETINVSLHIWKSSGHYIYTNCFNIKKYCFLSHTVFVSFDFYTTYLCLPNVC